MRKDRKSNQERRLAAHMHLVEYMEMFMVRYERPRTQYPALHAALEEVGRHMLLLKAEVEDGAPSRHRITADGDIK